MATFPLPPGEELTGPAGLAFRAVSEEEAWVYASWVTRRPAPTPPDPPYQQPSYEPVNPLYPDQIANPDQIYTGLNAARWGSDAAPFTAGLMQTVSVPDPASPDVLWSDPATPESFQEFSVGAPGPSPGR